MTDTYAGDSSEKRAARAVFWSMAPLPTPSAPALVLASRDGGDIEVLKRMGCHAAAIIAIDRDAEAIEACRARHGNAAIYEVGDVGDFALRHQGCFSSALLDFCAPVSASLINTAVCVARKVVNRFGIVLMLGREARSAEWVNLCSIDKHVDSMIGENPGFNLLPRNERRIRRRRAEKWLAQAIEKRIRPDHGPKGAYAGMRVRLGMIQLNPTDAVREFEADEIWDNAEQPALAARREVVAQAIDFSLGATEGRRTRTLLALKYVGHRAPMVMLQMEMLDQLGFNRGDLLPTMWVAIKKGEGQVAIKQLCLELPDLGIDVDRLAAAADVRRSTIAAWRAHRTMGTYDEDG